MQTRRRALAAAFPHTLPILAGFLVLGAAYGVYMRGLGFSFFYPVVMSIVVFAGSMEFVAASLLLAEFNPLGALLLTLVVNARHLFYGLSMLERFEGTGRKKLYLIYGMCDESFSINYSARAPDDVDRGWFMFFVTLLNQFYWVGGTVLGAVLGGLVRFDVKGIGFVMTALFIVILMEQLERSPQRISAVVGAGATVLCRMLLGAEHFIIPALVLMLVVLLFLRPRLEERGTRV